MNYRKTIGAGILAVLVSLPAWADMTKEEVIAKVEAGLSQAQRERDRDTREAAVEALLRAGVAPEKISELVTPALARNVRTEEVMDLARDVEAHSRGDKAVAEKYAQERFTSLRQGQEASRQLREDTASPNRGERSRNGFGAGAFPDGAGMGGGLGAGAFPGGAGMGGGLGTGAFPGGAGMGGGFGAGAGMGSGTRGR